VVKVFNFIKNPKRGGIPANERRFKKIVYEDNKFI
jgi:hypothetical protein